MRRKILIALGLAACLFGSGCYKKVVGAQGFGADRVAIENGNAPPDRGSRTLGYPKYTPKDLPGD
jgi:hypothetical protein